MARKPPSLYENLLVKKDTEIVRVFTDGGVVGPNPSVIGGTWAWVAVDKHGDVVAEEFGFVPTVNPLRKVSNNHTEQIAIVKALEYVPNSFAGMLCSDSA